MINFAIFLWLILNQFMRLYGEPVIYDTADPDFNNCSLFMCGEPQRALFRLENIVDTRNEGEVAYRNRPIVLRRCQPSSGCCQTTDQICTYDVTTKVRNVTVLFNFRNHSDSLHVVKRCITVPDDLACVCQKIGDAGPERGERYEISSDCPNNGDS